MAQLPCKAYIFNNYPNLTLRLFCSNEERTLLGTTQFSLLFTPLLINELTVFL